MPDMSFFERRFPAEESTPANDTRSAPLQDNRTISSGAGLRIVLRYSSRVQAPKPEEPKPDAPKPATLFRRMEICEPVLTLPNLCLILKRDVSQDRVLQGKTRVDTDRAKKFSFLRNKDDRCRSVNYLVLPEAEAFKIRRWLSCRHLHILFPSFLDDDTAAADKVQGDLLYTTVHTSETKVDKANQLLATL
jgi:hypothetical protein